MIKQVVINCALDAGSRGKYIGLSNKVPNGGSIEVTESTIIGSFISN